jgi:uncharacterized membrane protein YfcA
MCSFILNENRKTMKTYAVCTRALITLLIILFGYAAILAKQPNSSPVQTEQPATAAQGSEPKEPGEDSGNPPPPPMVSSRGRFLSSFEGIISIIVAAIGLIALLMEYMLLQKIPKLKAEDTLRVYAVTLIVIGTLFFVTAGFDSNHVAPAMGLFGTVAGYLLGRSIDRNGDQEK